MLDTSSGGIVSWLRWLWPNWIDRNLRIVLVARLTMSAARGIAGVVTALYLSAEGFSAIELGFLFLCVTAVSAAMASGIGLLADRFGRKPFLVTVPLLAAVAAVVYSMAREPTVLFIFAALGTLGRGAGAGGGSVGPYQPAESAFVAERAPGARRATAFGRLAFMSSVGALFGGLLAGLARTHPHLSLAAATTAYRPAFLAAGILAAAAGLLALGLREDRRPSSKSRTRRRIRWPRKSWPVLWRFWVTNSVNGVAIGLFGPFVSYWLYRRYGASPGEIGLLFALVNLGSLVSTLSAAGIGRKLGTVRAIVLVRAVTGLLLVPMVLAPAFWMAGGIYLIRMLAQRVGLPLRQSFTQDVADPDERASLAALSNLPAQGTMAGSQVWAGYLFQEVSLAAPFELAAAFQCANAVLYGFLFGRWQRDHAQMAAPDAEEG
ncbi:MAG TPA: MFS transporter [Candidatus Dormibacteraeota bacterium]|nr:MFS transporter [Candidatus Dormibacteraeota bacterium]